MDLHPAIFVGDANEALARVYAMLPRAELPDAARLEGELVGPYCRYSQTLPARIRFIDRGPGASLLAEAIVPDPCFWTPELPFLYKVELRVLTGKESEGDFAVAAVQRPFGVRRLGVVGTSIHLDARRFVPRGVFRPSIGVADLKKPRETTSALYVVDPSDEVLQEASEEGVLLAVRLSASGHLARDRMPLLKSELARLGRWPAVAIIVLNGDIPAGEDLRIAARGTLLAQYVATTGQIPALAPWAHLIWWQIDSNTVPTVTPSENIPIIAYRPAPENATIELGRRACDRLQADFAPLGDFAGYVC